MKKIFKLLVVSLVIICIAQASPSCWGKKEKPPVEKPKPPEKVLPLKGPLSHLAMCWGDVEDDDRSLEPIPIESLIALLSTGADGDKITNVDV